MHLWTNLYSGSLLFYGERPAHAEHPEYAARSQEPRGGGAMASLLGPRSLAANPFSAALRWLLRPNAAVRAELAEFRGGLGPGYLGVQMRVKESYCEGPEANATCVPIFWDCVDRQLAELGPGARVYLSTDSAGVQVQARARFGERVTWRRDIPTTGSIRDDKENRLLELLLLGGAERLLVTCGSSFGRLAYAWADKAPFFVTFKSGLWSANHAPGQCRQAPSAKPCSRRYHKVLRRAHPRGLRICALQL